jgi:hypothetical protein
VRYIAQQHKKKPAPYTPNAIIQGIIENIDKSLLKHGDFTDIGCTDFISTALRYHADMTSLGQVSYPADLTKQSQYFADVSLIRAPAKTLPKRPPPPQSALMDKLKTSMGIYSPPAYDVAVTQPGLDTNSTDDSNGKNETEQRDRTELTKS